MPRPLALFVLALFATLVGAPAVAWVAGVKASGTALENRTLHERPALTLEALGSGAWGQGISDWVWDTIPLRDALLVMDHRIDHAVFGDSPVPSTVILGRDGFAYTRQRVLGESAGGVSPVRLLAALNDIEGAFARAGVRLLFVVSPNKATIHPEHLPARYQEANRRTVQPTVDALRVRARTDRQVLDLWSVLEEEQRRLQTATDLPDERLRTVFRPTDDHWSVEAGRLQARAIVEALAPGAWDERYAPRLAGGYRLAESELSRIYLKLGLQEPYTLVEPSPLVDVKLRRVSAARHHSVQVFESRPVGDFTPAPLQVRVLRDSFLSGAPTRPAPALDAGMETLAPFFAETRFIHWNTLAEHTAAAAAQLEGADVVVVQVTQGNLKNVLGHKQKLMTAAEKLRRKAGPAEEHPR